jgi:hypothetical protein
VGLTAETKSVLQTSSNPSSNKSILPWVKQLKAMGDVKKRRALAAIVTT